MNMATLTSRGRITLPVKVRRMLNLRTGDRVAFVHVEHGPFELAPAARSVRELKGLFGTSACGVSIDEMNRVVAAPRAHAAQRDRRSK
ncbi:MAG: AbrB/MazE/SpoVT family DNA-binding domain-containing protein [Rubrivivax sp.]|nr:AbrB/MazE/SpoVT family DNA-binding domain-containing protein [Rubrivivax sp.]